MSPRFGNWQSLESLVNVRIRFSSGGLGIDQYSFLREVRDGPRKALCDYEDDESVRPIFFNPNQTNIAERRQISAEHANTPPAPTENAWR